MMTRRVFAAPPLNGVMSELIFLQNLPSTLAGHSLEVVQARGLIDSSAAGRGDNFGHVRIAWRKDVAHRDDDGGRRSARCARSVC